MNTRSASEYTMMAPAQLLRNWRDQRPRNQGDLYSDVMGQDERVYLHAGDLILVSFFFLLQYVIAVGMRTK
jgi:hypothetical protein